MTFGPSRGRLIFPFITWPDWLIRWCRGATCVGGCEDIVPGIAAAGQCGAPITTCWAPLRTSPRSKFTPGFRTHTLHSAISDRQVTRRARLPIGSYDYMTNGALPIISLTRLRAASSALLYIVY